MKLVKYLNYNKILQIILIIFGFFVVLSILSHTFDNDLGWHLRFGQDAWKGNFQYTDSYTWGYSNQSWVNHEWGGDLIFYWLYNNLGYFSLNIFVAIFLWAGFLGIGLVFNFNFIPSNKENGSTKPGCTNNVSNTPLTPLIRGENRLLLSTIIISLLALISVKFIIITRLAMLGPCFLVWLLWTLEKISQKKTYYYWPLILWLWSFFHGSWILGFIVINIYLVGNIIEYILRKNWKISNLKQFSPFVIWQIISAIIVMINPYGYKIWVEVIKYFGNNFYKAHITEWLSSYTYPIFWWPLIIVSFCAVIVYLGWKNKKITISQLLLFIAFFISGWMYKRNNLFMVLICIPVLNYAWNYVIMSLRENSSLLSGQAPQSHALLTDKQDRRDYFIPRNDKQTIYNNIINISFGTIIIALIIITLKPTIHYTNNVWQDNKLMTVFGLPYKAVMFLQNQITKPSYSPPKGNHNNTRIFNSYSWGGYLIWTMPQNLYFADGRSAATWTDKNGQLILQKHLDYLTKQNKLSELEQKNVNYIILQQNQTPYKPLKWYDKLLFNDEDINKAYNLKPAQIYIDLNNNPNWTKIYEDKISVVWMKNSQ